MNCYALLGGSFDPIHNGHLHIARQILELGAASNVVFLPNARHNFKQDKVLLDFANRFRLVQSVLEPGMEAWPDDSEGSGYTADLMKRLYAKHPDKDFLWVIGSDNIGGLESWHDFAWLRDNLSFLIIPRHRYPLRESVLKMIRHQVLEIEPTYESSSQVRNRVWTGKSIHGLVPEAIEEEVVSLYKPIVKKHAH
ncbi:MAG: nicotinate (nicotinamide) nucleotide adenylyltransferase [Candidatus Syntrophosphaera sp.]|nr:nicotinate (nicotinamide) nucleotide adenylyltransferase [Candidatus Syntrophosphaera sp.]